MWMLQQHSSFPLPFSLKSHVFCLVDMSNVLPMHAFVACVVTRSVIFSQVGSTEFAIVFNAYQVGRERTTLFTGE